MAQLMRNDDRALLRRDIRAIERRAKVGLPAPRYTFWEVGANQRERVAPALQGDLAKDALSGPKIRFFDAVS